MGQGGPYFGQGCQKAVWDKGVRYFTRGLQPGTPGSPRVPRNLPFHFLGEHVFPRGQGDRRGQGCPGKNQNLIMGTRFEK